MNGMTLGERIKFARGKDSQEAFAKLLGISRGALSTYEGDKSDPPTAVTMKICSLKHLSPSWMLGFSDEAKNFNLQSTPSHENEVNDSQRHYFAANSLSRSNDLRPQHIVMESNGKEALFILIPLVEARLAAGHGSFETSSSVEGHYAFRHDFLKRKGNPDRMVMMRVAGDSMEPEIKDSDVVLIDLSQIEPRPGKVYAVSVEEMVYLKALNSEPGKLILSSYNPSYKAIELDMRGDLAEQVRIIGKAIWIGREQA